MLAPDGCSVAQCGGGGGGSIAGWAATKIHLCCTERDSPYWCRAELDKTGDMTTEKVICFLLLTDTLTHNFRAKVQVFHKVLDSWQRNCVLYDWMRIMVRKSLWARTLKSPFVKSETSCFYGTAELQNPPLSWVNVMFLWSCRSVSVQEISCKAVTKHWLKEDYCVVKVK